MKERPGRALEICPAFVAALDGLHVGDGVVVLTWLHLADRDALVVFPRDDRARRPTGVFATRSADRPNPIGVHEATIVALTPRSLTVDALEAVDGTPVIDVKASLAKLGKR